MRSLRAGKRSSNPGGEGTFSEINRVPPIPAPSLSPLLLPYPSAVPAVKTKKQLPYLEKDILFIFTHMCVCVCV